MDAFHDTLRSGYGELGKLENQFHKREAFVAERDSRWRHGDMLFNRYDATVTSLLKGIVEGAETKEQPFVEETDFKRMMDTSQPDIVIEAYDEPLELPLTAIVSAVGFESWEEGRPSHILKDGHKSADVIKEYASRQTALPPIDEAVALILEDGKVIIMSSNAHRVGAAKLRGQSTIQIKELRVCRIKEEQPLRTDGEGLAVLAVSDIVNTPGTRNEQTGLVESLTTPNRTSRWRNFLASVNYRREHRRHQSSST